MWKVIIRGPAINDETYVLKPEKTSIGRSDENDLVLGGTAVSRHHAFFERKGETLFLCDLGSRNGTFVNGHQLSGTTQLRAGDQIRIGEHSLVLHQAANVENLYSPLADTSAGGIRYIGRSTESTQRQAVTAFRPASAEKVWKQLESRPMEEALLGGSERKRSQHGWLLLLEETAEEVKDAAGFQRLLEEALDVLLERAEGHGATVLLRHRSGALVPVAVRQPESSQREVTVNEGIVETALRRNMAMAVKELRDALPITDDTRPEIDLAQTEVLCAPIGEVDPVGIVYLNRPAILSGVTGDLEGLLDVFLAVADVIASAKISYEQQHEQEHQDQLKQALRKFHAPDIASHGTLHALEARVVTVLFADIAGFGGLVERLPPARISELLGLFYERMTSVVFSFEGTLEKFVGDSLMVIFGAPFARPNDPQRAVKAALAARDAWDTATRKFNPEERGRLKVGVHTGRVLVGTVGSEARRDYTALGQTVNITNTLCEAAKPGQVLVSAETVKVMGEVGMDFTQMPVKLPNGLAFFEAWEEDMSLAATAANPLNRDRDRDR